MRRCPTPVHRRRRPGRSCRGASSSPSKPVSTRERLPKATGAAAQRWTTSTPPFRLASPAASPTPRQTRHAATDGSCASSRTGWSSPPSRRRRARPGASTGSTSARSPSIAPTPTTPRRPTSPPTSSTPGSVRRMPTSAVASPPATAWSATAGARPTATATAPTSPARSVAPPTVSPRPSGSSRSGCSTASVRAPHRASSPGWSG